MFLHLWPGKKILRSPAKLYKVGYGDLDRFVYAHSSLDHLCQYGNDVHDLKLINMDLETGSQTECQNAAGNS